MRPSNGFRLLFCACACVLAMPAAATNLVGNGGFEITPNPGVGTVVLSTGSNALAPWTVASGNVEDVGQFYWAPAEGGCSLALNGTTAGAVAQTFDTVPGGLYTVTFSLSGDAFSDPPLKHLRVTAAGEALDRTFDTTPAWHWDMAWERVSWPFHAAASQTTIQFSSMDANADTGPAIDSVEVVLTSLVGAGSPAPVLALSAIAPNPSSGATRVAWSLPRAARARLAAYDVRGREAFVLADGAYEAGPHTASWDARGVAPGVYVLKLSADGEIRTRRLAVVR